MVDRKGWSTERKNKPPLKIEAPDQDGIPFGYEDQSPKLMTRSGPSRFMLAAIAWIAPVHLAQSYGRGKRQGGTTPMTFPYHPSSRFAAGRIVLSSCIGAHRGAPIAFMETDETAYMRIYINEATKRLILKGFHFSSLRNEATSRQRPKSVLSASRGTSDGRICSSKSQKQTHFVRCSIGLFRISMHIERGRRPSEKRKKQSHSGMARSNTKITKRSQIIEQGILN
jgi:hypothetical protein